MCRYVGLTRNSSPSSWDGDEDLTDELLSQIGDDPTIREGLFPGCGSTPSTADGGGKKKTEFHAMLADLLFHDHLVYGAAYASAVTAKEKAVWATKIKNRLKRYIQLFIWRQLD